jgi:hypothetical protein
VQSALSSLAATDVSHVQIRADHFGGPLSAEEESGIPPTVRELVGWASAHGSGPA